MAVRSSVGVFQIGLNRALKKLFFPHYRFRAAKGGLKFDDGIKNPKRRGKTVDRNVTQLVNLCKTKALPEASEHFSGIFRTQLIEYLIANRLKPVTSQHPVCDESVRVGTKIDLICKTADGKYAIIENKIGYTHSLYVHSRTSMRSPYQHLNDSLHNQMQLYLHHAVALFTKQHPSRTIDSSACVILRMAPDALEVIRMRPDISVNLSLLGGANKRRH